MNRLYTPTLLLIATLLTGCDDIGRAVNPTEIVEANGETYVIDQSTGVVSIVDGLQLKPLEPPSTEVVTLGADYPMGNSIIDFDFLITGDQVYWSGRVMPNIDSEEFESDEDREAFLDLWRRNITKSGNHITFGIEPLTSDITFGEFRINMSEVNVASRDDDGNILVRSGNGVKIMSIDYELIDSQGGTDSLFVSPVYVLDIAD
jgi:hypothetical protein